MASQEERLLRKKQKLEEEAAARMSDNSGVAPETANAEPAQDVSPASEPVAAAPAATETPAPVVAEPSEQRIRTAEGIAEAAGRDLRKERDESARLRALIEEQMRTIDTLINRQAEKPPVAESPAPVAPAPVVPSVDALTDGENDVLAAYDGLEPVFRKLARQEAVGVGRMIAEQLRSEFNGLVTPVRTEVETIRLTAQQQKEAGFADNVNALINKGVAPGTYNCVDIHNSSEFKEWVLNMEDFYGHRYVEIYDDAVTKSFDANIAARIQKEFLRNRPAPVPDPVITPAPAAPVVDAAPVPASVPLIPAGLEDQIAPSRAVGGEAPSGPKVSGGAVPTLAEVARLGTKRAVSPTLENEKAYVDALQAYNESEARKKTAAGKR